MANLTQLRMLEDLDGFLLVDKPAGLPFPTVVKTVKRKFNLVKVGHGGSLDAMASGLLVLLVNGANRFVGDVMGADRDHAGTMRLGRRTNTGDVHGETVAERPAAYAEDRLAAALAEFRGDIFQVEPRFCSVRREDRACYEVADTGEHSQLLAHVYRLSAEPAGEGRLSFAVSGTKALIVRALVDGFGDALGCGACLESLRRTRIGRFGVDDAVPFDRLLETGIGDFASWVKPLSAFSR